MHVSRSLSCTAPRFYSENSLPHAAMNLLTMVVHMLKPNGGLFFHFSSSMGYSCLPVPSSPGIVSWCPVDQTAGLKEKSGVWVGVCSCAYPKHTVDLMGAWGVSWFYVRMAKAVPVGCGPRLTHKLHNRHTHTLAKSL